MNFLAGKGIFCHARLNQQLKNVVCGFQFHVAAAAAAAYIKDTFFHSCCWVLLSFDHRHAATRLAMQYNIDRLQMLFLVGLLAGIMSWPPGYIHDDDDGEYNCTSTPRARHSGSGERFFFFF
jgi:hypothetical protein